MAEEHISRRRFIKLGAALGVGAAGASVLAACGGGGGGKEEAGSQAASEETIGAVKGAEKATGQQGVAQVEEGAAIARESEVAPGSAVEFTDEESGQQAVLVRLENGDFVAYSAICTHRGCTVAYSDDKLRCPCHGSVFDPARGAAVEAGPASTPLPNIPVEVRGDEVVKA